MKFISRTTMATILIEEIDRAVPRNSAVTNLRSGDGRRLSGSRNSPAKKPQQNGTAMPEIETLAAARLTFETSSRSVSMPVSRSSISTPSWPTPSIMLR